MLFQAPPNTGANRLLGANKNKPKCFGERATIVGTNRSDRLRGTPQDDVIVARGGADDIKSRAGNDLICAGRGPHANNLLETIYMGPGADRLKGGPGKDIVRGSGGRDVMFGGMGNDILQGMSGADELWGGSRHDLLYPGPGPDAVYGGRRRDTVSYEEVEAPMEVDLALGRARGEGYDILSGVENVHGSTVYENVLIGDDGPNWLVGGDPSEVLRGGGGNDHLAGNFGRDQLRGGPGFDVAVATFLTYRVHVDLLDGTFRERGHLYRLFSIEGVLGSNDNDRIRGDAGDNLLNGRRGNDRLRGRSGDDTLKGKKGADDLYGGRGHDRCLNGASRHDCE